MAIQGSVYAGFFDGTDKNRASYRMGQGFIAVNPNYWCEVTGPIGFGQITSTIIPHQTFSLIYTGPAKTFKLQRSTGCIYSICFTDPTGNVCYQVIDLPATGSHDLFDAATVTQNITFPGGGCSFRVTVTPERNDRLGNFVFRLF